MAMHPSAPGSTLRRGLARLGLGVLDALLPPHCLSCDAPVERQGAQCADCFRQLVRVTAPLCLCCGVPFRHAGQAGPGGLCPACLARPPAFAAARAALRYDDGARRLVLPFKHADRPELAAPLARLMAQAGAELLARADILAPVPLHWRRLVARRYNQAALLAQRLSALSGRPCLPDLLRRHRATPPLGEHGAEARAALLADAFRLTPAGARRVTGRRILLVDDVMTSGATAEACARVLRAAGAGGVDVLAAARVPDPRLRDGG